MTHNELIAKISRRASELSEMTVRQLRITHPDNCDGTLSGQQWSGIPKSTLICDIITEEFSVELDYELELE